MLIKSKDTLIRSAAVIIESDLTNEKAAHN